MANIVGTLCENIDVQAVRRIGEPWPDLTKQMTGRRHVGNFA